LARCSVNQFSSEANGQQVHVEVSDRSKDKILSTYFGDLSFDVSLEKCAWITTLPIPILAWEVVGHDMASNTCENDPTLAHGR
jgi:hypothetical protein